MSHRPAPVAARRRLIVPSTIGCLLACGWLPAAQSMTTTVTQPFLGVTHTHIETTNPRLLDMHVVAVDLSVPGIGFAVTPSNGSAAGETVGKTTRQFLGDQKVQVAINGGFSAWVSGSNYDVQGLAATRGEIYSSFEQYRTFALDISADNVATILRSPSGTGTAHYPDIPLYNTLPGEARLLRDGSIVAPTANETLHPRTAVGLSGDQRTLYLFTVDGRNTGHSLGVTRPELADFMRMFGATDAINLDGGGSTTLVFADPVARLVNVPVGVGDVPGTERVVGSNFGVYALPMPAPAAITLNVTSGTQTQWQAGQPLIVNALSLEKSGPGTLVLDAANTFTGGTEVRGGILRITNSVALRSSPTVVRSGAVIDVAEGIVPRMPSLTMAAGSSLTGIVMVGSTGIASLDVNAGASLASAGVVVAADGRMQAAGDGTLLLRSLAMDPAGYFDIGSTRVEVTGGGFDRDAITAAITAGRAGTGGVWSSAVSAAARAGCPRTLGWRIGNDGTLAIGVAAAGDVDLDGVVDILDISGFLAAPRFDSGVNSSWAEGDFNSDGVVDVLDIGDLLSADVFDRGPYGVIPATVGPVSAVPEPALQRGVGLLAGYVAIRVIRNRGAIRAPAG